jgi:hypothetical protein
MTSDPITCIEEALLKAINAARTNRETLHELIDDTGRKPDYESMEAVDDAKIDEEAAMAWLEANSPKCPSCKTAFAFQRQPKRRTHCSWCGYNHETGAVSQLVPASLSF